MAAAEPFELLSEKAAARILQLHPDTLRRWRKAGRVRYCTTATGRVRYRLQDLVQVASPQWVEPALR